MIIIQTSIKQDSATTDPDDVLKIKNALLQSGHYELPDYGLTPYPDKQMFNAIRSFQKENYLKEDGIINPDGETLEALNQGKNPGVKSPTMTCPQCGGPHGGSKGSLCPPCDAKS